ncbi:MAG: undecaprenyl-diphosphatase UppP [Candidatus Magasanikbacteria bacterium]
MQFVQAFVLGIIQGITEFLPISSSGHLIFVPKILGWSDQGMAFDVMVHLGTLFAVVWYFRKRIFLLLKNVFPKYSGKEKKWVISDPLNFRLAWFVGLSIIPAGIVGFLFNDYVETNFRDSSFVALGLVFWGIVLGIADWYGKKKQNKKTVDSLRFTNVLAISFAQAIALMPGTSRSGITMTTGLFSGLTKKAAAEFSFLMSIPIIFIAGMTTLKDVLDVGITSSEISVMTIGFFSAVFSGYLAVAFLMRIIEKYGYSLFVWYRIILGVLILLFL